MKAAGPEINFKEMEEALLENWENKNIFSKQEENRKNAPKFSFYDGPPFANGLPHYGHLLANTIKDTVPRYWIMRGFQVNRRFGWDCHGLPVEFEVEKTEKLKGRPDILKMGVGRFNEICRKSVLHYTGEWKKTITRLGRWVDWDQQYRTMDRDFMESVWWVFGQLHKKGLVYKDFKVVPYSPRTASVVSNFEANQNYQDIQDPSITIKVKLAKSNDWLLVWTTTPWTLPSNLAIAVNPKIDYVKIKDKESQESWILAKERVDAFYSKKKKDKKSEKPYQVEESFKGDKLLHQKYEPIFPYFKDTLNAFQVLPGEFVNTENGTGIVHQAPAYGEDDFYTCKANEIALVDPIDDTGCFKNNFSDLEGLYFKDADKKICQMLKEKNVLLKHETLVHSYPFDERTNTPLMYKAVPSWYVAVTKFADKLIANNQKVNWVPNHIKDGRMGTWLSQVRDWAISRNRFWGTPLPVWVCSNDENHIKVISSVKELENLSGQKISDIHQHKLEGINFKCDSCQGTMKVVDVVFDCWFESGSMPYAQVHYPFDVDSKKFEKVFPADFIAEGLDQTRGWFYTLSVLSTALFDQPAFKNVIVNGTILDQSGKKMSKRHRNYTPPEELINKYGADSVRLYMLNSPLLRSENLIFSDDGVKDITRQVLLPLWNAHSFLSTYAKADAWEPTEENLNLKKILTNDLDRWILSKRESLNSSIAKHMEAYELYRVIPELVNFTEDLTNWYIRLNRRRFWGENNQNKSLTNDQKSAYASLYTVLLDFSKILAPFAPFLADEIYKNLISSRNKAEESVHLSKIPETNLTLIDENLEYRMSLLKRTINQGRSLRQKHKIKIRQVLSQLTVIVAREEDKVLLQKDENLIRFELNVKSITFTTDETSHIHLSLKPNLKTLGRKLGKRLNELRNSLKDLNENQKNVSNFLQQLKQNKQASLSDFTLNEEDFLIERGPLDDKLISSESGVTVLLDINLTPELIYEGWAREIVNRIQNLRKDSGFLVTDRIKLQVVASEKLSQALEGHKDYIQSETLGTSMEIFSKKDECNLKYIENYLIEQMPCTIAIETVRDK